MSSDGEQRVVSNKFVDDLLHMVNNPNLSDITFFCEDGIEVHACRLILASRSLFFNRMFFNGMAESSGAYFALPTFTSSVLVIVLKYLYAEVLFDDDILDKTVNPTSEEGTLMSSEVSIFSCLCLDWKVLSKVIAGARFLMLERLEKNIIGRLLKDLPCKDNDYENGEDAIVLDRVACALSALCDNPSLFNQINVKHVNIDLGTAESVEYLCFTLIKILAFYLLPAVTLSKLSKGAFHIYLAKTMNKSSGVNCHASEYLKLREVLTWCALRAKTEEMIFDDVGQYCLPGLETTLRFLQRSVSFGPHETDPDFDFTKGREVFARNIAQEDLKPLLPMVNFLCIDPKLLMAIIEPLNLIDAYYLFRIYRVQARRRSRKWGADRVPLV